MPAAGYELRPIARRGAEPQQPAEGRARGAARPAARGRRGARGSCATCAPTPCSAAAATSPARSGSPRWPAADPARADRGRQPPGAHQPAARAAARGASAWRSRSTGATASATSSPAGRCRRRRPTAPPRASASASREDDTCVLVFGGSLGARTINEAAVEALAGAAVPRPARVRARATTRRCARGSAPIRRQLRPARVHHALRRGAAGQRPRASRAPAARSSRSPRTGARRSSFPYPARDRRPPDRQRALDGARRARRWSSPDAELTPERLAREVRALLGDARGWRRWGGRRRRWRGPTPPADRRRGARRGRAERSRRRRAR